MWSMDHGDRQPASLWHDMCEVLQLISCENATLANVNFPDCDGNACFGDFCYSSRLDLHG
jgi:hypothetical protein